MRVVEIVRQAAQQNFVTEDGDPAPLELDPPLSDGDIEAFEAQIPCSLPDDVRDLLRLCKGFAGGPVDIVDFTGADCSFEQRELLPYGLPIAGDGYGNFWVIDLLPTSGAFGPIYFACHDPPIFLYQSQTLDEFLVELFKLGVPPHKSLIDDVHEDRLHDVWRSNPGVLSHEQCLQSADAGLCDFASQLGDTFQYVDMREVPVGFGFSWGRYGPRTVVKRHGDVRIFAYERKQGLLSRLLGRSA
jgi:cell wall assembly regulator SMI1